MFRFYFLLIIIFIFNQFSLKSNSEQSNNVLLLKPLTAAVFEPRIGSIINLSQENLRLDIGSSFDLYRSEINEKLEIAAGGDFFTYTRLRSEPNFKFPVETSDYFFGVNFSSKFKLFEQDLSSRLRISHISSHLVDGYSTNGVFFKQPFVYSREFADLVVALNKNNGFINYRFYGGLTYVFSTTPSDLNSLIPYLGGDFVIPLNKNFQLNAGLDIRRGEFEKINSAAQFGITMKFYKEFGLFFGYYKYFGSSMHGLFYSETDNYDGIGFQIVYF